MYNSTNIYIYICIKEYIEREEERDRRRDIPKELSIYCVHFCNIYLCTVLNRKAEQLQSQSFLMEARACVDATNHVSQNHSGQATARSCCNFSPQKPKF